MGFFNWLFGRRQKAQPTPPPAAFQHDVTPPPAAFQHDVTMDVPQADLGVSPFADPKAVANVESLMREAKGLPIGSVRGNAVAHVKVDYARGSYFLNGKRASLEELRREFARLAQVGGVVFYYKESPTEQMPPEAEAALAAICEARLPVTFAARDYDPTVKVAEYYLPEGAW
jgi:hypothetical protein